MAMEQTQEFQLLDKNMMATKLDESSKTEPETWYKVVLNAGAEEAAESPSQSEDELSTSNRRCLAQPTPASESLILSQMRVKQQHPGLTPFRKLPYGNQSPTSLPN